MNVSNAGLPRSWLKCTVLPLWLVRAKSGTKSPGWGSCTDVAPATGVPPFFTKEMSVSSARSLNTSVACTVSPGAISRKIQLSRLLTEKGMVIPAIKPGISWWAMLVLVETGIHGDHAPLQLVAFGRRRLHARGEQRDDED